MSTIYIVTSEYYSDYGIDSVFSTKEKAQAYIDAFALERYGGVEINIEEWPVDELLVAPKQSAFFVRMKKDGGVVEMQPAGSSYGFRAGPHVNTDVRGHFYFHIFADDVAHAIKIANERRVAELYRLDIEAAAKAVPT